jgi:hypothetical protein
MGSTRASEIDRQSAEENGRTLYVAPQRRRDARDNLRTEADRFGGRLRFSLSQTNWSRMLSPLSVLTESYDFGLLGATQR